MTRRVWLPLTLILILSMTLGACGGGANAPEPAQPAAQALAAQPTADPQVAAPQVAAQPTAAPEQPAAQPTAASEEPTQQPTAAAQAAEGEATATPAAEQAAATPAASGEQAAAAGSGTYAADLGFRPEVNGFGFENYGKDTPTQNMTADDVRRMFGDKVCGSLAGGKCILTPPAEQWMQQANAAMDGGHCEGFATLSALFYLNREKASDFGADKVVDLQLGSNEKLQREIAYWFITQATEPARTGLLNTLTPGEIVDKLIETFKAGAQATDTYTIGIYKRDRTGGHAVLPYAVEDAGNGLYNILIYDNNYPKTPRMIKVDRNQNTWSYEASINPSVAADLYEGDADTKTLELASISPRIGPQVCSFCDNGAQARAAGMAAPAEEFNEIWMEGEGGHLLITDDQGRRLGWVNGKYVNEIPGTKDVSFKHELDVWEDDSEPVYYVPTGIKFTIGIDGSEITKPVTTSVTMIGPGYDLAVDEIKLDPGQKDTLAVSPDGTRLSYKTDSNESPNLILGVSTEGADYAFLAKGVDIESGGEVGVALDMNKGQLSLNSKGNKEAATYALVMDRIDDAGELTFYHDAIELAPGDTVYADFAKWTSDGSPMPLELDKGSDGTIDETLEMADAGQE